MKYKVGDRVRIKSFDWYNKNKSKRGSVSLPYKADIAFTSQMSLFCGQIVTITRKVYFEDVGSYLIKEDKGAYMWTDEMIEELVEETSQEDEFDKAYQEMIKDADERFKNHKRPKVSGVCQECVFAVNDNNPHCGLRGFRNDFNVKSCSAKNNVIPNGFELQSDGYFSWINKKEYPKTYDECCRVLGVSEFEYNHTGTNVWYRHKLMATLDKLMLCRDAYWKLYGEEMGLGKPWEPDWDAKDNHFYTIHTFNGKIECSATAHRNAVLIFPTAEMRDAFYENFKVEIEQCKELL